MLSGDLDGRVPSGHSGCGVATAICDGNTVGTEGVGQPAKQSVVAVECPEKASVLCPALSLQM